MVTPAQPYQSPPFPGKLPGFPGYHGDSLPYSMTGFGAAEGAVAGGRLRIEIRTVNHRHFNLAAKLPSEPRQGPVTSAAAQAEVAEFVRRMKQLGPRTATGRGRLVFAMDATMSRQPTWDMALALQADMFQAVKAVGGLDVQLIYFRGTAECRASRWVWRPP